MRRLTVDEFNSSDFQGAWNRLTRDVPLHDIGQTYPWVNQWWKTYRHTGVGKKELFMLVDEQDNKLTAVWPLMIRNMGGVRTVEFIGQSGGMTTDYVAPLVQPGLTKQSLNALWNYLFENTEIWDFVEFKVPAWSGLYQNFLESQSVGRKSTLKWDIGVADHTLSIRLPDNFEEYVSSLGKRTRQDIRKYLRGAEEIGAKLSTIWGTDILKELESLYDLNAQNWSIFTDHEARQFMTACADSSIRAKSPIFLCKLEVEGRPCAMVFGYMAEERCFLHPAGVVREKIGKISPGTTLYAMLICKLINEGLPVLDMSPGLEEYKFRLGSIAEPIYKIQCWHADSRIRRRQAIQWARSAKGPMQWGRKILGKLS